MNRRGIVSAILSRTEGISKELKELLREEREVVVEDAAGGGTEGDEEGEGEGEGEMALSPRSRRVLGDAERAGWLQGAKRPSVYRHAPQPR